MSSRKLAILIAELTILIAVVSSAGAADCSRWQSSFSRYEKEVYEAIRDEPEDLVKELQRFDKASRNGDFDRARRIETKIRDGLAGLREIRPHPEMSRFHLDLIAYYSHGVDVLDAVQRGDDRRRRLAEVRTWQSLRSFFVTMRRLLADHGCDEGDIEAIDRDYLPYIDGRIEELAGLESMPVTP